MSLQDNILHQMTESIQTQQIVMHEMCELIELASQKIVNALLADRKVLTCGNAASVSMAQYFASMMINRYERSRPSLPVISLVNDVQLISSIAGVQQHYDDVYAKQLRALAQTSDVLLLYSIDVSSPNLTKLISAAHDKQVNIVLLVGENEVLLPTLLHDQDVCITVPSQSIQRIHEVHLLVTHCLCDLIDSQLFGNPL